MSLLALEGVGRRYGRGSNERVVLREVTLELDGGELVVVWGLRHSGRTTLLRVAAGIEPADSGEVRFGGRKLNGGGNELGGGIGYCQRSFKGAEGRVVLEELMVGQLARGVLPGSARDHSRAALERCGVEHCATHRLEDLDGAEAMRVTIARALTLAPALLVIDEPTKGIDLIERDGILSLLRSLADEGIAILMSAGEATGLSGADRALSLADGELRGSLSPELASVVSLHRRASA
jgi:ABC-type cobalamin/Fe3+-siderophores transport system ATPase subunit